MRMCPLCPAILDVAPMKAALMLNTCEKAARRCTVAGSIWLGRRGARRRRRFSFRAQRLSSHFGRVGRIRDAAHSSVGGARGAAAAGRNGLARVRRGWRYGLCRPSLCQGNYHLCATAKPIQRRCARRDCVAVGGHRLAAEQRAEALRAPRSRRRRIGFLISSVLLVFAGTKPVVAGGDVARPLAEPGWAGYWPMFRRLPRQYCSTWLVTGRQRDEFSCRLRADYFVTGPHPLAGIPVARSAAVGTVLLHPDADGGCCARGHRRGSGLNRERAPPVIESR